MELIHFLFYFYYKYFLYLFHFCSFCDSSGCVSGCFRYCQFTQVPGMCESSVTYCFNSLRYCYRSQGVARDECVCSDGHKGTWQRQVYQIETSREGALSDVAYQWMYRHVVQFGASRKSVGAYFGKGYRQSD